MGFLIKPLCALPLKFASNICKERQFPCHFNEPTDKIKFIAYIEKAYLIAVKIVFFILFA